MQWRKKSAKHGNADAQYDLALCYENGEGVEQNSEKAVEWYTKAAEQGHDKAQFNLAVCYGNGEGVEQNPEKAFEWYIEAAEQGCDNAQNRLALCYENGEGVEKNYEKAVEWYTKAAGQGYLFAQSRLAHYYETGKGVEQNHDKASEWYQEAFKGYQENAEQGSPYAQFQLGFCYADGEGVEKNMEKALEWYKKAAEQDYFYACGFLAELYYKGNNDYSIETDYAEAFKWAFKATECEDCDFGNPWFILGDCYHNGLEVKVDLPKAIECYQKAISMGYNCNYALEMARRDLNDAQDKKPTSQMQIYAEKIRRENVPANIQLVKRIQDDLADDFMGCWDDLKPNAKQALISGMLTYVNYYRMGKDVYDKYLDFTGVIAPLSKALEIELAEFFHTGYLRFLKLRGISPTEFGNQRLSFIKVTEGGCGEPDIYEYVGENDTRKFSLGSLYYTMEQKIENGVEQLHSKRDEKADGREIVGASRSVAYRKNQNGTRTISKFMAQYADELFAEDAFSKLNRESEIVNYMVDFATDVYTIMQSRNPAAHADTMKISKANGCGDYLIKVQKLICNFVSKIKPEYRKGYQPKTF